MRGVVLTAIAVLAASALATGCESREARRLRVGGPPELGAPALNVTLCSRYSRKSGKRSGVGRVFTVAEKSRIYALADFGGLASERDYTAHLVWIRPDGRELFRRYAEFRIEPTDSTRIAVVRWLDAVDLHDVKADTIAGVGTDLTLDSTLNISADKERDAGLYRFRVYLDRRLVREESFTVEPGAAADSTVAGLAPSPTRSAPCRS